jgi:flagellar biosynthesis anti-sigma factor FlgM
MVVHDRSNYPSTLQNPASEAPSRLRTDGQSIARGGSAVPINDSSEFSSPAQLVQQALQLPDIRHDRVASLQQQIAGGTYQIAPQDVAEAMLRNLRS